MNINLEIVILVILLIFIVIHLNPYNTYNTCDTYSIENYETNAVPKNNLRYILYIFHTLCEQHKIYYIIAYGTLLGAVRHRGMIPWDDDIDVIVLSSDRKKIEEILNIMKDKYDIIVSVKPEITKLWNKNNSEYCMDIFYVKNINNKIVRIGSKYNDEKKEFEDYYLPNKKDGQNNVNTDGHDKDPDNWWWNGFGFDSDLIEDRTMLMYDGFETWAPKKYNKLLKILYGKDYLKNCRTHYLKNHDEYVETEKIPCSNLNIIDDLDD